MALVAVGALGFSACSPDAAPPLAVALEGGASLSVGDLGVPLTGRYLILGRGDRLPANLEAQVAAAGGRLTSVIPEIGVALAEPLREDFAARMAGVRGVESVTPDIVVENVLPERGRVADDLVSQGAGSDRAQRDADRRQGAAQRLRGVRVGAERDRVRRASA